MAKMKRRMTSDRINVEPLRPDQIATKYRNKRRNGKTARDKAKATNK